MPIIIFGLVLISISVIYFGVRTITQSRFGSRKSNFPIAHANCGFLKTFVFARYKCAPPSSDLSQDHVI